MILNLGSLSFNTTLEDKSGTPAWGTEMGQGEGYKYSFEGMNDLIMGMSYQSVNPSKEVIYCPLGKGGNQQDEYDYVLASIFDKIYVNDNPISGARFLLLIVKKTRGAHHVGRRTLKYNPKMTYNGLNLNEKCFEQIRHALGIKDNAAWFINEINIINQDELHFTAYVVNPNNKVEFSSNEDRQNKFKELISNSSKILTGPNYDRYSRHIKLLLTQKNLILTGAPGTGKTYMAKAIAASIIAETDWAHLTQDQKDRVGFVQFHPSYDYTDFVEGLRPVDGGDFKRQDGVFKSFCKRAAEDIDNKYIFIIDEINRGELSKIFGELFYAIEPEYRGEAGTVQTQYNNLVEEGDIFKSGFYIPENVYIIGTMNDVDRGVEAMDFAIRRRFAWAEVTAEESAKNMGITGLALEKMKALNATLTSKEIGLTSAHCIGGAYFRKLKGNDFESLWKYHLEGIVYEYFRGEPDADDKLYAVKKAYDEASLPKSDTHESPEPASAE